MKKSAIFVVFSILLVLVGAWLVGTHTAATRNRVEEPTPPPVRPTPRRANSVHVDLPSLAGIAEAASPAVVNVATTQTARAPDLGPFFGMPGPFGHGGPSEDFFRRFGIPDDPGDGMPKEFKRQSLGSGFLIDTEGHVVTNHHVVAQADEVIIRLASGSKEYNAKIVGTDAKTDLAVVKIDPPKDVSTLRLGRSEEVRVGDWIVAIGNPFGLERTVTAGIVSATERVIGQGPYDDFIQTDASINPGNSGGPLLNLDGEVIGIATAIFSRTGGNMGIGFAIPSSLARSIVDQLKSEGKVVRGWLGVTIQELNEDLANSFGLAEPKGALVAGVEEGGPAAEAGIEQGDVIVRYRGKEVDSCHELPSLVAATPIGETAELTIVRKGDRKEISVEIEEMPGAKTAAAVGEEGIRTPTPDSG